MQILIIGAGYAGLTAALRLSKGDPSASITLVNPSADFRERIRDHQVAIGQVPPQRPLKRLLRGTGVRLVVGWVDSVDRTHRRASIVTRDAHDRESVSQLRWDYLIVATGSSTPLTTKGAQQYAHTLDGAGPQRIASRLRRLVRAGEGNVVVVGGGLTGIETAAEIATRHPSLSVTIVSQRSLAPGFSQRAQQVIERKFSKLNIVSRPQTEVIEVEQDRVVLAEGAEPLPCDLCIWATGFVAGALPSGIDLTLDERGRVFVNASLAAINDSHVFVVGDCAAHESVDALTTPGGCKSAGPSGIVAAENVLRAQRRTPLRLFRFKAPIYCVSLGSRDALVQWTGEKGEPVGRVVSGRIAVFIKNFIFRFTLWMFAMERWAPARYGSNRGLRWLGSGPKETMQ